jgi:hypothetical protein
MNMEPVHAIRAFCCLMTLFAIPCLPQKVDASRQQAGCSNGVDTQSRFEAGYRALRELEDPATHQHWLLIRDRNRATGPALFVKQGPHSACAFLTLEEDIRRPEFQLPVRSMPVIRAGDQILLLEHTTVSDAELEATALEAAAAGAALRVRIKFGGLTVRAIAVAPGQATLVHDAKEWRP